MRRWFRIPRENDQTDIEVAELMFEVARGARVDEVDRDDDGLDVVGVSEIACDCLELLVISGGESNVDATRGHLGGDRLADPLLAPVINAHGPYRVWKRSSLRARRAVPRSIECMSLAIKVTYFRC